MKLSIKKTRIGSINNGFHFLGINYLETQAPDSTKVTQKGRGLATNELFVDNECLFIDQTGRGGKSTITSPRPRPSEPIDIVPHARTIRNAREQVRFMVIDGFSTTRIRSYLRAWVIWWVRTSQCWTHQSLLSQFIQSCYDARIADMASGLLDVKRLGQQRVEDLMAPPDWLKTV